jgi:hypothetical protein
VTKDFVSAIHKCNRAQLLSMLRSVGAPQPIRGWPAGKALEHLVLRAFEIEGAIVQWPFAVDVFGETVEQIDGAVHYHHLHVLCESKDFSEPVNIEPIAKLRNQLIRRPAGTMGMVFARSGFTEPAKTLTRMISPLNVLLWEFGELEQALDQGTLCRALTTK